MKYIAYTFTLRSPVLLNAREGDSNTAVSHSFIPGNVLRGLLIERYRRIHAFDVLTDDVRQLFFDGQVRYLNAYPEARFPNGETHIRLLPTPVSFKTEKADTETIYDAATGADNEHAVKKAGKGFFQIHEEVLLMASPARNLRVHIERSRNGQAIGSEENEGVADGQVFRYEALASRQSFAGYMLYDEEVAGLVESKLLPLIDTTNVFIGRSRGASYGSAILSCNSPAEAIGQERDGFSTEETEEVSERVIITLLSDLLLRDKCGGYSASPEVLEKYLSRRLNSSLTLDRAFVDEHVTGGFNGAWGLPLSQAIAFKKGSVFILTGGNLDSEALQMLMLEGIGDRRTEGYGRFAWAAASPVPEEGKVYTQASLQPAYRKVALPAGHKQGKWLMQRLFVRHLEQVMLVAQQEKVNEWIDNNENSRWPSTSQLTMLQQQIHASLHNPPDSGVKSLLEKLGKLASRDLTRKAFSSPKDSEGKSFLIWLKKTVQSLEKRHREMKRYAVWPALGLAQETLPTLGGLKQENDHNLAYTYTLRYLHGVLDGIVKARKAISKDGNTTTVSTTR